MSEQLNNQVRKIDNILHIDFQYDDKIDKQLGKALGKCLEQNKNDVNFVLDKCQSAFSTRIFPLFEQTRNKNYEAGVYLKKCLDSKQNAYICAQKGLKNGQKYFGNTNNSNLKSLLN